MKLRDYDPIFWWYAGWKTATAIVIVVGGTLPTIFLNWDTMLPSGKLVAFGGLVVSAWKSVDLVIDRVMSRIAQGKTPLPLPRENGSAGDTQHIEKPK